MEKKDVRLCSISWYIRQSFETIHSNFWKKFEILILAITHYCYFRHVIKIVEQITRNISHTLIISSGYWNFKNSRWKIKDNAKHFLANCATKVTHKTQTLKFTLALFMREQIVFANFVVRVSLEAKLSEFTRNQFTKN